VGAGEYDAHPIDRRIRLPPRDEEPDGSGTDGPRTALFTSAGRG
jgi:hypothetical protein